MKKFACILMMIGMVLNTTAQTDGLLLRYDFSGVSGTSVPDASASGCTAQLMNDARVVSFGDRYALDLGTANGYLDMTSAAGTLLRKSNSYAISVYYNVAADYVIDGNGYFLWAFSTSAACTQTAGKYCTYRLNAQKCGTSTGGWGSERGYEVGSKTAQGRWVHVLYQVDGGTESLYIDGTKVGEMAGIALNTSNFGSATVGNCWIGRAPFDGDNYLGQTLVTDFRLYGRTLSAAEIAALAAERDAIEQEYMQSSLRLHFDFDQATSTTVTDAVGGSIKATTKNQATITDMGSFRVLSLGTGSGYLDMTSATGNVFKNCDDYTICSYYCASDTADLSGNGRFLWSFSTSAACTATDGKYHHYRLNVQRAETSTGGYSNTFGFERGSQSEKGRWIHVAYTMQQGTGRLYVDGVEVGSSTGIPAASSNFGSTSIPYCWLGRACFSGDNYLQRTLVYDFRIYDRALTAQEIRLIDKRRAELDYQYLHGTTGDNTSLLKAISTAQTFLASASTADYMPTLLDNIGDNIDYAISIANSSSSSQALMDRVQRELEAAVDAAKANKGVQFVLPPTSTENITDRGFRHPGLLHTEADFERIRAQLAAGNPTVTAAYNQLVASKYANGEASWPTETIVRGGTTGQNYINTCRGAAIAYQNALRWKIEGNRACAGHAVNTLMNFCHIAKYFGGDSNWALACGLQGYQFANAAELVRDYDGWSEADFNEFKQWMVNMWHGGNMQFLRYRNGTWENPGKWWRAPGHYWSNWPLCNALSALSIGILCDDPFLYNQGMSYFKYDQCGTFNDPRPEGTILSDGLTDFLGNLVVTTAESELETSAYGRLGQMQESGRDGGHAAMALGLAVDIAKTGWNQGDDLFAYMDHRLAAGIEFLAGQILSLDGMPWTDYHRFESGFAWTDSRSWIMTDYARGAETRPYWGTIIGVYESVKGVPMPLSDRVFEGYQPDPVTNISVSGNADHLGYSILMNTRDVRLAPASSVPTELSPKMTVSGTLNGFDIPFIEREQARGSVSSDAKVTYHSELGAIVNNYWDPTRAYANGQSVTLEALLPADETDTGNWVWDTGETTKTITVSTDVSHVYRVTYTNSRGVKSEQCFSIAVDGDCLYTPAVQSIYVGDVYVGADEAVVDYASAVTLDVATQLGGGTFLWSNGETGSRTVISHLTNERDVYCIFTNYGGRQCAYRFHLTPRANDTDALVLDDSKPEVEAQAGTYSTAVLRTDMSSGQWQTICLPFDMSHADIEQTFGTGSTLVRLNAANGTMLNFLQVPALEAHRPYLLLPTTLQAEYVIDNVTVSPMTDAEISERQCQTVGDVRFIGTYTTVTTGADLYSIADGRLGRVSEAAPVRPLHAYFDFSSSANVKAYLDQLGGTITGLPGVEITASGRRLTDNQHAVYDLQGRRVADNAQPTKGVYIMDGRKIVVR